ncbi:MAG: hypothetical protein LUK37_03480 [Clostridia bacterium]|nr:hypothetical protein [Clostridia bacterium]
MMAKRIKKAAILACAGFVALSLPGVGSTALGAPSNRETRVQGKRGGVCSSAQVPGFPFPMTGKERSWRQKE